MRLVCRLLGRVCLNETRLILASSATYPRGFFLYCSLAQPPTREGVPFLPTDGERFGHENGADNALHGFYAFRRIENSRHGIHMLVTRGVRHVGIREERGWVLRFGILRFGNGVHSEYSD